MSSASEREVQAWASAIRAGEVRAVSRAITAVENRAPGSQALLRELYPYAGKATVIGITGPSGVGKSTLSTSLAKQIRQSGRTVGILAIDPTSPFSGGALLGDRIRMQAHSGDAGVYIRSMATRGALGGLSQATFDAAAVLDAAGRDFILIETVGTGQDEVDIAKLADITLVVLVPELGDEIQAFKAGIMEIADIFVVNKSDLPGADRVEQDLNAAIGAVEDHEGTKSPPPIVKVAARSDEGMAQLLEAVTNFVSESKNSGAFEARRVAHWRQRLTHLVGEHFRRIAQTSFSESRLLEYARAVAERSISPYDAVAEIVKAADSGHEHDTRSHRPEEAAVLDHLGIGVKSLAAAVPFYEAALGLSVAGYETVAGEKTRVAMLPVGDSRIELLEPTEPQSAIGRFLEKRGEGLHHICLRVPNLRASIEHLKKSGVTLINDQPQVGAGGHEFVFIHPRSSSGVLIELVQEAGK